MAKTSINIQPVKAGSEEHNLRIKQYDYVRQDLSHLNIQNTIQKEKELEKIQKQDKPFKRRL